MTLRAFALCASLVVPVCGYAQSPASAAAFADEAAVAARDEVVYRYASDGTGVRTETTVLRVQSAGALQTFGVLGFPYASGTQALAIVYARVRKPDGTVVETPVGDAQDQPAPVTQIAPMYSDVRMKQLPVRSLAVGDTLEFETRVTQKQAEVPGEFWNVESFGAGMVYLDRRIELRVPKTKKVTVWSPKFPAETAESGEERVYRWKGAQLKRSNAKDEEDAAAQDKTPPIAWTTFPSWEAVGAWYQGLIAGRDAVTPAIQAKADELTAGAKTDADKVRVLYEYVSQHNHYIGVDFGIGRFQPHTATEVLTNQYGDCKDKHTLLAALLRAKGFEPSAALIGLGVEMNEKVPMPEAFNHLITEVDVDGGPVWLDATTEVAPYRVLLAMLRDKQALVVPAKGAARLAKTPAELPFAAVNRYEGNFELGKDGTSKGDVVVTVRGDDEVIMRYASRQIARAQWDQLGQSWVDGSGFNGKANTVMLDTMEDLSVPWKLRYGYTQEAWSEWKSHRIGSLLPNVNLPSIDEKKPPTKEIDLGGRHTQTAKSTVRLPPGYAVELPDAIHLKTGFATFDETYRRKDDGSLVSEFTLEVLKPKVAAAEWKSVKKFVDDIGTQPWIEVTTKEKDVTGKEKLPVVGSNVAAAGQLVRQTHDAIMAKDLDLARKKSDQAIALNDKQPYAWSQRGWLAWQRHDLDEAASDYERELRQHPNEIDQYPDLIRLEGLLGRPSEKKKYLLEYMKAAPENASAILFTGSQLLADNNVNDAVEVYRTGAKALPDNKLIQVELGSALLRAGKREEAVSVVQAAVESTNDPDVLNDGAYVLVSEGSRALLPLAETGALKGLETLEKESAETPLEAVNAGTFSRMNLLLATWDTLGWVYFAEGKDGLAEEYVRASWRSAAHAEEGLHMGEILEKKGDDKGAMRVYEMALSRVGGSNAGPVATELHARMDELKKKGVAGQEPHPESALQQQRTFHVPRPAGVKGSGVFALQVSAEKTEKVAMMSGDEGVRGLGEALGRLDLGLAVPKESKALLLRSGVLFCSTEPTCEFVLTPPESANVK